jgi:hypothetical protein
MAVTGFIDLAADAASEAGPNGPLEALFGLGATSLPGTLTNASSSHGVFVSVLLLVKFAVFIHHLAANRRASLAVGPQRHLFFSQTGLGVLISGL